MNQFSEPRMQIEAIRLELTDLYAEIMRAKQTMAAAPADEKEGYQDMIGNLERTAEDLQLKWEGYEALDESEAEKLDSLDPKSTAH